MSSPAILDVRDLVVQFAMPRKSFFAERQYLQAVRGISFKVMPGKTLGIVGESGSGKTTSAMAAVNLVQASGG
ncbi:MAG: ATP-binding cassette domain-containing protein, partial [Nitratireductor sp.]|nr:ATP-binding cassette domain-containing protein [Nitratireductor sp.]